MEDTQERQQNRRRLGAGGPESGSEREQRGPDRDEARAEGQEQRGPKRDEARAEGEETSRPEAEAPVKGEEKSRPKGSFRKVAGGVCIFAVLGIYFAWIGNEMGSHAVSGTFEMWAIFGAIFLGVVALIAGGATMRRN